MTTFKKYIKQHRILLIVNAVFLVLYIILAAVANNKMSALYSQQEASRWQNNDVRISDNGDGDSKKDIKALVNPKGMPYAQISAFVSPGRGMTLEELGAVRSSLTETLVKDSYAESENGGRVWIDAYSGEADISLRKDNNTLSVTAMGVGGEFFQFHPMELLSGSYISDEDINHDRIVVDENFAWAMFGSNDIAGMQVWLDNSIYFIAGVVRVDEDKISQMAYGNTNRVYMFFDELTAHQDNVPITCYEAVFPNPISNYAFYALKNAFGLSEESEDQLDKKENPLSFDDVEVIENTKRYDTMELFMKMRQWKLRSMRTASVGYPFWENVARVSDDEQMVYLLLRVLLLICPMISLIWVVYDLWERRTWTVKGLILEEIDKARERRAWKAYEAKMTEKEEDASSEDALMDEPQDVMEKELKDITEEASEDVAEGDVGDIQNETSVDRVEVELRSITGDDIFSE